MTPAWPAAKHRHLFPQRGRAGAGRVPGGAGSRSSCFQASWPPVAPAPSGILREAALDRGHRAFAAETAGPGSCRREHEATPPAAAPFVTSGANVLLRATVGHSSRAQGWVDPVARMSSSGHLVSPPEEGTAPWSFNACLSGERGQGWVRIRTGTLGPGATPAERVGRAVGDAVRLLGFRRCLIPQAPPPSFLGPK